MRILHDDFPQWPAPDPNSRVELPNSKHRIQKSRTKDEWFVIPFNRIVLLQVFPTHAEAVEFLKTLDKTGSS